ncbi:AAA family ATPase [Acidithiobacillus ferrivorans]|nr:AAA family ATPase [Acidithiobacillus ferrivorans]
MDFAAQQITGITSIPVWPDNATDVLLSSQLQATVADLDAQGTVEQKEMAAAFADLLASDFHGKSIVVGGYAGTGKTWLAARLVRLAAELGLKVAVCAPTHKAVEVLAQKLTVPVAAVDPDEIQAPRGTSNATAMEIAKVSSATLHALLGVKLKEGENGLMLSAVQRSRNGVYLESYDVVFVDEASMVGSRMLDHIRLAQNCGERPLVVYVGDPGQLMPVEEEVAPAHDGPLLQGMMTPSRIVPPVFIQVQEQNTLTEIVRQKDTGRAHPIAFFAQEIRHYIEGTRSGVFSKSAIMAFISEHREYMRESVIITQANRLDNISSTLRQRFPEKETRIVSWRNFVVDKHNTKIHQTLRESFLADEPKHLDAPFWPGEIIVARDMFLAFKRLEDAERNNPAAWEKVLAPINLSEDPEDGIGRKSPAQKAREERDNVLAMVPNNAEMLTVSCWPAQHPYLGIGSWLVTAKLVSSGEKVLFYVANVHRQYEQLRNLTWAEYMTEYGGRKQWSKKRTKSFDRAWTISRACVPVLHTYAMTTHKSQGSTFHHVLVDLDDLVGMIPRGADGYHRALYVAVTRASERVWLTLRGN